MDTVTTQSILMDLRNSLTRSVYLVERIQAELRGQADTHKPKEQVTGPGFEFKGTWYSRANATEILVDVLRFLAKEDESFPERLAQKVRWMGNSRNYIVT